MKNSREWHWQLGGENIPEKICVALNSLLSIGQKETL